MRQLPASLSVDADPTNLVKSLKDEQGDLVAPVQQKLLKRILSEVTPKREPVTPRRAPKREPTPPLKPSRIPFKIPKKQNTSKNVSWDELPFAQEGPEPDIDGAVNKTLRKMRKISAKYSKTPRLLKILKPAKGWTSWDPSGKKKKKQKSFFLSSLGSVAKKLAFDDSKSDGGGSSNSKTLKNYKKQKKFYL